ncbi:DUF951 domain-containing protein [Secundilactobacillus collinoides]|uniref:DUF951 domain-containing protein n=1 Tax=Secundilactobacillus collinoides TaxID=33960 RepID=UPI0006D15B24|nr:DUF951 domain-containing protein [Secundilactobacillus collinoides]
MYDFGDIVEMKKPHPCGVNRWQIIRMGADIKIKCTGCGHIVMLSRREFEKKLKKSSGESRPGRAITILNL